MKKISTVIKNSIKNPISRNNPLTTFSRVLRWQIGSRLLPGEAALPFVEDTFLFAKRGMTGATGNWYYGLDEVNEMGFVLHATNSEDLFVDIGANIGSFTVLAAGVVGASTISIEPVKETFDQLVKNISLNNINEKVTQLNIGVSDNNAVLKFTNDQGTINHVIANGESAGGVDIEVETLDQIIGSRYPSIIKIDVEGYELPVIDGANNTLSKDSIVAVIMETNRSGSRYGRDDSVLFERMSNFGFRPFSYDAMRRKLSEYDNQDNAIFIRNLDEVNKRIGSSRRFRLTRGYI